MVQSSSIFDANTFLETTHKGQLDTAVVLVDEGDYMAQITDKIEINSGTIGEGKQRAGEAWANVRIQWEIMDSEVVKSLNMPKVFVTQSLMLDLTDDGRGLDLGVNKNMRLKRLLDATGLNSSKNWSINQLKFQTAYVKVKHRRPDGFDDDIAEVVSVSSVGKAEAKKAAE